MYFTHVERNTHGRAHQAILHGKLTRTPRGCRIPRKEQSKIPFNEGRKSGSGYLQMDTVAESNTLLQAKKEVKSSSLIFHIVIGNSLGLTSHAQPGKSAGCALEEEAVKFKTTKHGRVHIPLPTCSSPWDCCCGTMEDSRINRMNVLRAFSDSEPGHSLVICD